MIRLLTVAAWLTMMGVVAIPSVGFGEANDPKERDALARALPQAPPGTIPRTEFKARRVIDDRDLYRKVLAR